MVKRHRGISHWHGAVWPCVRWRLNVLTDQVNFANFCHFFSCFCSLTIPNHCDPIQNVMIPVLNWGYFTLLIGYTYNPILVSLVGGPASMIMPYLRGIFFSGGCVWKNPCLSG